MQNPSRPKFEFIWRDEDPDYQRREQIRRQKELDEYNRDAELFYQEKAEREAAATSGLSVSDPNDASEQQADTIARQVVNNEEVSPITPVSSGDVQPKQEGDVPPVTPSFESKLNSTKGGGSSLDESTRTEMESKMGTDFSQTKIHTGNAAGELSQEINAKAFTHGQDIYFNSNQSPANKELLAHELVHAGQAEHSKISRYEDDWIEKAKKYNTEKFGENRDVLRLLCRYLDLIANDGMIVLPKVSDFFVNRVATVQKIILPNTSGKVQIMGEGAYDGMLGETTYRAMLDYIYNQGHLIDLEKLSGGTFRYGPYKTLTDQMTYGIHQNIFITKVLPNDSIARKLYGRLPFPGSVDSLLNSTVWDITYSLAVIDAQSDLLPEQVLTLPGQMNDELLLKLDEDTGIVISNLNLAYIGLHQVSEEYLQSLNKDKYRIPQPEEPKEVITDPKEIVRRKLDDMMPRDHQDMLISAIGADRDDEYYYVVRNDVEEHLKTTKYGENVQNAVWLIEDNLNWLYPEYLSRAIPAKIQDLLSVSEEDQSGSYYSYLLDNEIVNEDRENRAVQEIERMSNKIRTEKENELQGIIARLKQEQQKELDDYIAGRMPAIRQQLREADFVAGDLEMNAFISLFVQQQTTEHKLTPKQQKIMDDFNEEVRAFSAELGKKYGDILYGEEVALNRIYEKKFEEQKTDYLENKYNQLYYFDQSTIDESLRAIKSDPLFTQGDYKDKQRLAEKQWEKVKDTQPWAMTYVQLPNKNMSEEMQERALRNYRIANIYWRNPDGVMRLAKAEFFKYILEDLFYSRDTEGNITGPTIFMLKSWAEGYMKYLDTILDPAYGVIQSKGLWDGYKRAWGWTPPGWHDAARTINKYRDARRHVQTMVEKPEDDEFWTSFAAGMRSKDPLTIFPFVGTLVGIEYQYRLYSITQKMEEGKTLTDDEYILLQTYSALQQLNAILPDNLGYKVGYGTASAIPFMLEMVYTAGAFTMGAKIVEKSVTKIISQKLASHIAGKILIKSSAFIGGAFMQTFANPQQIFYNVAVEYQPLSYMIMDDGQLIFKTKSNEDVTALGAWTRGILTTASAFLTEHLGNVLISLPRRMAVNFLLRNPQCRNLFVMRWILGEKKIALQTLLDMKVTGNYSLLTGDSTFLKKFASTFAVNGPITEYLEEVLDQRFNMALHGQDPTKINWNDELATFITVTFISGPLSVAGVVQTLGNTKTRITVQNTEDNSSTEYEFDNALLTNIDTALRNREQSGTVSQEEIDGIVNKWNEEHPGNKVEGDARKALNAYYAQMAGMQAVSEWAFAQTGKEGNIEGYKALISLNLGRVLTEEQLKELENLGGVYKTVAETVRGMKAAGVKPAVESLINSLLGQHFLTDTQRADFASHIGPVTVQFGESLTPAQVADEWFLFSVRELLDENHRAMFDRFRITGESTTDFRKRIETMQTVYPDFSVYLDEREGLVTSEANRPGADAGTDVTQFQESQQTYAENINASSLLQNTSVPGITAMSLRADMQALIVGKFLADMDAKGSTAAAESGKEKVKERFERRSERFFEILNDPDMPIKDKKKLLHRKLNQMERFFKRRDLSGVDFDALRTQVDAITEENFGKRYLYDPNTDTVQVEGTSVTLAQLQRDIAAANQLLAFHNIARSYSLEIRSHGTGRHHQNEVIIHTEARRIDLSKELMTKITNFGFLDLKLKLESLDEVDRTRFMNNFAYSNEDTLRQLNSEPDLVDVWNDVSHVEIPSAGVEFLQAIKKIKNSNLWTHIEGEVYTSGVAVGGHYLGTAVLTTDGITGITYVSNGKIRFKPSDVIDPNPYVFGMEVKVARRIEINNGSNFVTKNNKTSFFPNSWTKDKIIEEVALAFVKAKQNPGAYWVSGNAYDVLATDGTTLIRVAYGNSTDINPLVNGTTNPVIKTSFPKY